MNLKDVIKKKLVGNSVPTSGNYNEGDIIINSNPSNSIYAWVCTVSGDPGEWDALGSLRGDTTTFASTGSSYAEIYHGLGSIPSKVSVIAGNRPTGNAGILYVAPFNNNFNVYFNTPVPEGEEIKIHWIMSK